MPIIFFPFGALWNNMLENQSFAKGNQFAKLHLFHFFSNYTNILGSDYARELATAIVHV